MEAWALRTLQGALAAHCPLAQVKWRPGYLNGKGAQYDGAKDGIPKDAVKDVALPVDLSGIDLIEELHHDEGVEDDGVVLRGWRMEGGVPPAVDLEHLLTCQAESV